MENIINPDQYKEIKNAWKKFVKFGEINKNVIRPIIAESWIRCKKANLNPYINNKTLQLNKHDIIKLLEKNKFLVNIALPIIRMAANLIVGSGFRIDLVDSEGYILKSIVNEQDVLKRSRKVGSIEGNNRSELFAGTNGIGLALYLEEPVQIFGAEHYNIQYHRWTCACAPIRINKNKIIGVINISGHFSFLHKHTKGMAASIAKDIENAIIIDQKVSELTNANKFLGMLINSIYDGLIVVDSQNNITHINLIGAKILGIAIEQSIGKKLDSIVHIDSSLLEIFKSERQHVDKIVSVSMPLSNERKQFLVTTRFIKDNKQNITNTMTVFGEMKRIQRLASGIIGAKARFTFKDIIHKSEKMERIVQIAKKIARSNLKVLINGESGTGKELFAQSIHNESIRKDRPFIAINCAALPRDLVESELFGYDEGAFTGAKKGGRLGKFELADGGTLFLDEIETMPLDIQPKLLRVIESNEIMPLGSNKLIPINVRVISSTNKELDLFIKENKFREDLFYRLNTTFIDIPPLRERKEDILVLIKHFVSKLGYEFDENSKDIKKALEALLSYNWPGNVRELENVIENIVILSKNHEIVYDLLPDKIKNCIRCISRNRVKSPLEVDLNLNLEYIEEKIILTALKKNNGNNTKAALDLGIDRTTLIRKRKKYEYIESTQ